MIALATLPAPKVIEELDFETLLAARKARYIALHPAADQSAVAAALSLESEPVVKLLQEAAYTELLLRQRVNEAAAASTLALATASDLDHLVALLGVARLDGESDERLRLRAQLSLEALSVAGPRLAYVFHALSASPAVVDVSVDSPAPGQVRVAVLAAPTPLTNPPDPAPLADPDGVPSAGLLATVLAAVNSDTVRPLCDVVTVQAAQVVPFTVTASLYTDRATDPVAIQAAAKASLDAFLAANRKLGRDVNLSALHAALHVAGVTRVVLNAPVANVEVSDQQVAVCTATTLNMMGVLV